MLSARKCGHGNTFPDVVRRAQASQSAFGPKKKNTGQESLSYFDAFEKELAAFEADGEESGLVDGPNGLTSATEDDADLDTQSFNIDSEDGDDRKMAHPYPNPHNIPQ